MGLRRTLAALIGALQSAIGVLAVIFAFVLHHNFFDIQSLMNMSENVTIYMLLLFVFGFVSIISGLFLIHERLEL